jgi:hypothetical protein
MVKFIKNIIQKNNRGILFLTYFLVLAIIFSGFFLSSCSAFGIKILGSGKTVSEDRQVSGIESISIGSSMNLIIEQTGNESVRIEAAEDIIPIITTEMVGSELQIELKSGNLINIRSIDCYVSVKDLNAIKVSSSASVKCDNLKTENLSIEMASSSKGSLNVDVTNLDLRIASSANLSISGKTDKQNTEVNSSGKLDAFGLVSKDCTIVVQSSGNANINVTDNLDVTVKSSGRVNYKGNPKVNSDVASAGSLNKVGN